MASRTFNIDLWQYLKMVYAAKSESQLQSDAIFFGVAKENQPAPYCVIHILNSGEDVEAQTLCKNEADYNEPGEADIQFSLYATNDMVVDELLHELNNVLKYLKNLSEYRILSAVRQTTKNASSFTNEVGMGLTRYTFKYESL